MYEKSRVTSKYQITLPKRLRKKLDIQKGDDIIFEEKNKDILIRVEKRTDPIEAIEGILEGEDLGELKSKATSKMLKKRLGL